MEKEYGFIITAKIHANEEKINFPVSCGILEDVYMIQCVLWAAFPGMLAETRVIAISPSCQLYFNWPPPTFGKMRSNRNRQPALFVYTSVWLHDLASPPGFSTSQHTWVLWDYSGREEQGNAWNSFVLWAEEAGAQPARWAVPKSAACCVFWQAVVSVASMVFLQ